MPCFRLFLIAYFLTWLSIPHLLWLKKRPVSTLAWIWGIILFPFIGALAYAVFGTDRMKRKRLRRREAFKGNRSAQKSTQKEVEKFLSKMSEDDQSLLRVLSTINQIPTDSADSLKLLVDASTFYPALEKQIEAAEHHVHIQFYIWRNDEVGRKMLNLLVEAAKRGVQVRVLLDELGCFGMRESYFKPLQKAGGKFSWFLTLDPRRNRYLLNLRNHRKLQVIDGKIAFIGGMNLGREYLGLDKSMGKWRDIQMQLDGSVVSLLQESFADDWFFATQEKLIDPKFYPKIKEAGNHPAQIMAGGPDSDFEPMQKSIFSLFERARKRIWFTTAYFAPNEVLLNAIQICAARGVDVRLLVAEKIDHQYLLQIGRSYYEDLLRFGVRIFEYGEGVTHSKVALIDDDWLMVGSANLDNRSMRINFELNLLVQSAKHCRELSHDIEKEFKDAHEIKLHEFKRRGFRQKAIEAVLRPFAPAL